MEKKVKYGLAITISGAVINLGLALVKLFIGIVSSSVSIFFDAINNFMDILGSAFGAVGIGVSSKKPTEEYPNGFGRMEYVMTFVITAITILVGGIFIFYSVERLLYPFPVFFGWLYFGLLIMTVVIKLIMGIVYFLMHKKDHSDITKALYLDSFMDTGITATTVICYALTLVVDTNIDAILGILIGVFILIPAIKMMVKTIKNLLGYNVDIDVNLLKDDLVKEGIFSSISELKINDYGKNNVEVFVIGDYNEDNKALLKEIENREKIKIYVVKE